MSSHARLCLIWVHAVEKSTLWPFPESKIMRPAFSQQVLQHFPLNSEIVPLLEGLAVYTPYTRHAVDLLAPPEGPSPGAWGLQSPVTLHCEKWGWASIYSAEEGRNYLNFASGKGSRAVLHLAVNPSLLQWVDTRLRLPVPGHWRILSPGTLQSRICSASRQNPPSVVQPKLWHGYT